MMNGESRVKATVWDDRDWLALPLDGQWLYQAFLSQKYITKAGVLPLPRQMWANLIPDDDGPDRIEAALKLLVERRFVVVDYATDELLVRTYIRNNVQHGPPGTFRSAMDAAIATRSPVLRAALYTELLLLSVAVIERKGHRGGESPIAAYRRALAVLAPPSGGGGEHAMDMPCVCHVDPGAEGCPEHGMRMPYRNYGHAPDTDTDVDTDVRNAPVEINSSFERPAHAPPHTPTRTDARPRARAPGAPVTAGRGRNGLRNGLAVVTETGTTRLPAKAQADLDADLAAAAPAVVTAGAASMQALRLVDAAPWQIAPTGRERGKWLHAVSTLLVDGIPGPAVVAGMSACIGKGYGYRQLDSFVFGEANKAAPASRADRNVSAILSMRGADDGPGLAALAAAEQAERRGIASNPRTAIEGGER